MKRLLALLASGCAFALLAIAPATRAEAATACDPLPHCYSVIGRSFSPGATEVWATLNTFCQTIESGTGMFDTNEIWALTDVNSQSYVEFGHARQQGTGAALDHWFWARTNSGVQQEYDLSATFVHGTDYNATIQWGGSAGSWKYWQGGALYGNGSGSYPSGPVVEAEMGGEMHSTHTNTQQNSFIDGNAGRIQSGVSYTGWANPVLIAHDAPPYDLNYSHGDTFLSDENPSVGGVGGC